MTVVGTGAVVHGLDDHFERSDGFRFWTVGCTFEGSVSLSAGGRTLVITAPALLLAPPQTPYGIEYGGLGKHWSECWAFFTPRPHWRAWLEWPEILPGLFALDLTALDNADAIMAQFSSVHEVAAGSLPERQHFMDNALEKALLMAHVINPAAAHAQLHPAVRATLEHVAVAFSERIDVASLARRVQLSPSHLAHLFTSHVGDTPMRYVENVRMERAKQLLMGTNRAIADIAEDVGYDNPFHFSTRFRKLFKQSPRAFRQRPHG